MKCYYKIILLCLLLNPLFVGAQQFRHINVEQGLSSRQCTRTLQDRNNLIWISTKIGIDRYNGEAIKHYTLPTVTSKYSPENYYVVTDNDLNIWVYSDVGHIYQFNYEEDCFDLYFNLNTSSLPSSLWINELLFEKENTIAIATNTGLYFLENQKLRSAGSDPVLSQKIESIERLNGSSLMLAISGELYLYHFKENTIQKLEAKLPPTCRIQNIWFNPETSRLWIGTFADGVFCYDAITKGLSSVQDSIAGFPTVPIRSFQQIDSTTLLIGTDGRGVWNIHPKTLKLKAKYRDQEAIPNSLLGDGVYDIFQDNKNRIWVSTYTGGVSILDPYAINFRLLEVDARNTDRNKNFIANAIVEDRNKNIWIATNNGIRKFDRENKTWHSYLTDLNSSTNVFLSIATDNRGYIWAGSYGEGVYVLSPSGKQIQHYSTYKQEQNKIGTDYVFTIFCDSDKNLWIGGREGKLSKFDTKTQSFTNYQNTNTNAIVEKSKQELYICGTQGVVTFQKTTGETNLISTNQYVNSLCIDNQQNLYYGTRGFGLYCYSPKDKTTRRWTSENGLPSDHVYSIVALDRNLWISTEQGITRMSLEDSNFLNFSENDGLPDQTFLQNSGVKTSEEEILFGSYHGMISFDPSTIKTQKNEVKLFFEEFRLFNKKVSCNENNSPITKVINETSEIELLANQHSFSLDFCPVSYFCSDKVNCMWKLDGMDNDWVRANQRRSINYTNLSHGEYCLHIKALDYSSEEVLDERSINIYVAPPFYLTYYAWFVYIVVALLLLRWVVHYAHMKMSKKHSDDKVNFFTNTAHDLRTPLTLVSAPINELKQERNLSAKGQYYLGLSIENIEKLTNLVDQLLDFQKSDLNRSQLVVSKIDVVALIQNRILLFQPLADRRGVQLRFEANSQKLTEWVDATKFDKILENLISNAVKYTHKGGSIDVRLLVNKNNWEVRVKDTGIGISKQAKRNLFKHFYRGENAINSNVTGSGIGLLLVQNYVKLHKGKIKFESEENKGSEFRIILTRGKSHLDGSTVFIEKPHNSFTMEESSMPNLIDHDFKASKQQKPIRSILIAEDNHELRNYLKTTLNNDYQVLVAENGKMAFEMLDSIKPDLIISDVKMPILDGIMLSKLVRKQFSSSHIPMILLSALNEKEDILKGLEAGVDDYLTKPFDSSILKTKIKNLIHNREEAKKKILEEEYLKGKVKVNFANEKDKQFIDRALLLVDRNIDNVEFSVLLFSREIGVSKTLLYDKLKALTGQTPNDFIKHIRLNRAKELLRQNRYSISEIATRTGFDDPGYFSTCFKKQFKKSPSKYFADEEVQV